MTTTEQLSREEAIRRALADLEPRGAEVGFVTGRELAARVAEFGHVDLTVEEVDAVTKDMISEKLIEMVRLMSEELRP
jgi:hypothetical protein